MASQDERKFADLYQAHRSSVWLYCRRRVGPDRADDAMGDVFLAAWRRIDDSPPTPEALPWLYRIAHLTVSNHWRSLGRRRRLQQKVESLGVVGPQGVADQVVVRDEVRRVVDLLDRLKASDAEVLRLAAWERLDTQQIADVLGITSDAAKQRLSRARTRLARLYERANSHERGLTGVGKEARGEH